MQFEWDRRKAESNVRKHNVSFEDAATVLLDTSALIIVDDEHSVGERREIIIGYSTSGRLLVVSFTERIEDVIRIINSRSAVRKERTIYERKTRS